MSQVPPMVCESIDGLVVWNVVKSWVCEKPLKNL